MSAPDLEVLARAHALFAGRPADPVPGWAFGPESRPGETASGAHALAYRQAAAMARAVLDGAARVDAEVLRILREVNSDHREGRLATAAVLAAARADTAVADNPIAARELLRRSALRLRAQRDTVLTARRRSRRSRAELLALRYRRYRRRGRRGGDPRARAAVRAALTRLGCPYVWGATGPDRFDCSGLVKWAYAQAGVPLHRTTYEQIHDGVPVARSQVRPGDLVFPHAGHVQLAIGGNMVVEAPYAGAAVRIAPMGNDVAIRRPV